MREIPLGRLFGPLFLSPSLYAFPNSDRASGCDRSLYSLHVKLRRARELESSHPKPRACAQLRIVDSEAAGSRELTFLAPFHRKNRQRVDLHSNREHWSSCVWAWCMFAGMVRDRSRDALQVCCFSGPGSRVSSEMKYFNVPEQA